jgi:pterin-4a-carbinolamine dehydratase
LYQFSEQKIAFQNGDGWGFLDTKLNEIVAAQYNQAWSFHQNFARIAAHNGIGYLNRYGKITIEPTFQDARDFSEGLARVAKR